MSLAAGTYKYKAPPKNADNNINFWKELLLVVQNLYDGKSQNTGQFNLEANATSTVVKDPRCCEQSVVLLSPYTANALAHHSNVYVSDYGNGQFTITHDSKIHTDRTYRYVCIG